MPQIACAVILNLETVSELPDDGFDQTAGFHHPVAKALAMRLLHVDPQWRLQIESQLGQLFFQNGTDKSFVTKNHAADAMQVQVNQGIAFVNVGSN